MLKVLIIRLSAMGDIVHGLPAVALLKERLPDLELTWLVEPAGKPLLEGNPAVDRVITFPKGKWLKQLRTVSSLGATAAEAKGFVAELKSLKFDAVIDFQGLLKSSVLALLSGSKMRFGFKGTREGAERLLTHAFNSGDYFGNETHVVDHNLRLADYVCRVLSGETSDTKGMADPSSQSFIYGSPSFPLPAPSVETLENLASLFSSAPAWAERGEPQGETLAHGDSSVQGGSLARGDSPVNGNSGVQGDSLAQGNSLVQKRTIAFIPGTTWKTKIWDPENWVALGRLCLAQTDAPILLLGGPSEQEMNLHIAEALGDRVLDLTGKTNLLDLIAIFQRTGIVIGADTGPLHLAAAVSKPKVLAVFGSTPPGRNGPYGSHCSTVSLKLECQPCFKKVCPLGTLACLKELTPETVFAQL